MSRYAVAMSIGPVGDFIAGGRRSRDLWYGSRLISELTRQVAFELRKKGAAEFDIPRLERLYEDHPAPLFFPGLDENGIPAEEQHKRPTISNRILCTVTADNPNALKEVLEHARDHAFGWVAEQLARLMKGKWFNELGCDLKAFADQREAIAKGDFLEIQAAYRQLADESPEANVDAQKHARVLLDAAKNTRAFRAATFSKEGRRKSSQDAGRDSVLIEAANESDKARLQVQRWAKGLRIDERLDAVALLRRNAVLHKTPRGRTRLPTLPFPPLHRVAADSWLDGARNSPIALRQVLDRLEALADSKDPNDNDALLLLSSPCSEPRDPIFPFDPSLLFEGGLTALERELDRVRGKQTQQEAVIERARSALRQFHDPVDKLHRERGIPSPYYALVTADGDGMGSLLNQASPEKRKELVRSLYDFADEAWKVIEHHAGCAFYVGGDELAAYLPVDKALPAAVALQALYQKKVPHNDASLSVGVVVAHVKEDLRAIRRRAHEALGRAKSARRESQGDPSKVSWLCVEEQPRGATPRSCMDETKKLHENIEGWVGALTEDLLSMKTAHDLRTLKERFQDESKNDLGHDGLVLARALALQKTQRRDGKTAKALTAAQQKRFSDVQSWREVELLINELLLAAHIKEVQAQRVAGPAAVEEVGHE